MRRVSPSGVGSAAANTFNRSEERQRTLGGGGAAPPLCTSHPGVLESNALFLLLSSALVSPL